MMLDLLGQVAKPNSPIVMSQCLQRDIVNLLALGQRVLPVTGRARKRVAIIKDVKRTHSNNWIDLD